MKSAKQKKSCWKDIGDLRKPHAKWRLRGASRWWARALGLPDQAVVFLNPDGSQARPYKTLGGSSERLGRVRSCVLTVCVDTRCSAVRFLLKPAIQRDKSGSTVGRAVQETGNA